MALNGDLDLEWAPEAFVKHLLCIHLDTMALTTEDNKTYLDANCKIIDIGDADIIHTDTISSHKNIEFGVRKILTECNSCNFRWRPLN